MRIQNCDKYEFYNILALHLLGRLHLATIMKGFLFECNVNSTFPPNIIFHKIFKSKY